MNMAQVDFENLRNVNLTQEEIDKLVEELLKNRGANNPMTEKEVAAMIKELLKYLPADQVDMFLKKLKSKIWG
jgi:methionine salvage enolase-phosphatase E1